MMTRPWKTWLRRIFGHRANSRRRGSERRQSATQSLLAEVFEDRVMLSAAGMAAAMHHDWSWTPHEWSNSATGTGLSGNQQGTESNSSDAPSAWWNNGEAGHHGHHEDNNGSTNTTNDGSTSVQSEHLAFLTDASGSSSNSNSCDNSDSRCDSSNSSSTSGSASSSSGSSNSGTTSSTGSTGTSATSGSTTTGSTSSGTTTSSNSTTNSASTGTITSNSSTATAGQPLSPIKVAVEDQSGNIVTSDNSSTVTLTINSGPTGAKFDPASVLTATVQNGVATFSNVILDTAGQYTLTATDSNSGVATAISGTVTVNPGAVTQLVVQPVTTPGTVGQALSPGVSVQAEDQFGNVATSDNGTVTLNVASGSPGSFGSSSATTVQAQNGVATFNNILFNTATPLPAGTMPYFLFATQGSLTSANSNAIEILAAS